MNRRLRRMLRFGKSWSAGRSKANTPEASPGRDTAPDPRAKNQVHGKVTADKWNQ
jgi:hypothetical protein